MTSDFRRILLMAVVLAVLPEAAAACRVTPYVGTRDSLIVHLIGTPRAASESVGAGAVLPGAADPVHGQFVDVERVGEPWAGLLPADARAVILVPWDRGVDCRPLRWQRSPLWLPLGERGMLSGRLRDRQEWVDGVPVLDVFSVDLEPYPSGSAYQVESVRYGRPVLNVDEMLDLVSLLPLRTTIPDDADNPLEPLERWVAADAGRKLAWPVSEMRGRAATAVSFMRYRHLVNRLAGTYELEVTTPSGMRVATMSRTSANDGIITSISHATRSGEYESGAVTAWHGSDEADLPVGDESRDRFFGVWYMMSRHPLLTSADSTVWKGDINGAVVAIRFATDSTERAEWQRLLSITDSTSLVRSTVLPGRWVERSGEPLRFEWEFRRGDEIMYTVRARRVSGISVP